MLLSFRKTVFKKFPPIDLKIGMKNLETILGGLLPDIFSSVAVFGRYGQMRNGCQDENSRNALIDLKFGMKTLKTIVSSQGVVSLTF